MKPRVGLVVPAIDQGGGVSSVARFIKDVALRSHRFDLKVVSLAVSANDDCNLRITSPGSWMRGAIVAHSTWEGLPVTHVGAVAGELEFQRYLPRQILAGALADCNILQVVCGSPAWASAVCGLRKPVSVHCATRAKVERRMKELRPRSVMDHWRKAMTRITDQLDRYALRTVDAIQVMNSWMLEYARRLNLHRRVDLRYAPPGIPEGMFTPSSRRKQWLDQNPYILCVGRLLDPRKNIGLLLEAYALIPEPIRQRLRLVLAGKDGPPESFWVRADGLGLRSSIQFIAHPSVSELVTLYQQASVFALCSDEEGFGVALLEAMGCGVPVVSTRSGGPEGIITDGKDGFLVQLDDPRALAGRIVQLSSDAELNATMGNQARQTIEHRFAETVTGEAFLQVWDHLLSTARKL